jgi:hypothetical protein
MVKEQQKKRDKRRRCCPWVVQGPKETPQSGGSTVTWQVEPAAHPLFLDTHKMLDAQNYFLVKKQTSLSARPEEQHTFTITMDQDKVFVTANMLSDGANLFLLDTWKSVSRFRHLGHPVYRCIALCTHPDRENDFFILCRTAEWWSTNVHHIRVVGGDTAQPCLQGRNILGPFAVIRTMITCNATFLFVIQALGGGCIEITTWPSQEKEEQLVSHRNGRLIDLSACCCSRNLLFIAYKRVQGSGKNGFSSSIVIARIGSSGQLGIVTTTDVKMDIERMVCCPQETWLYVSDKAVIYRCKICSLC